jgi:hypothetical protein
MKLLIGILIGCFLVCILGAIQLADRLEVSGTIEARGTGNYVPVFSGMTADGECLLAITNSTNGDTEIFQITKETQKKMSDIIPFQGTSQKTVYIKVRQQ